MGISIFLRIRGWAGPDEDAEGSSVIVGVYNGTTAAPTLNLNGI
jgi:hypothetical protein